MCCLLVSGFLTEITQQILRDSAAASLGVPLRMAAKEGAACRDQIQVCYFTGVAHTSPILREIENSAETGRMPASI
jgi:hypothetical protein